MLLKFVQKLNVGLFSKTLAILSQLKLVGEGGGGGWSCLCGFLLLLFVCLFVSHVEKMWVYVMISVRLSGRVQKLNVGLFLKDYGTKPTQTWYDYNHHWALRSYTIVGDLWLLSRSQGQHMCKIGSFSILGTAHVIKLKLGMNIKYINRMSCIPVLFG